MKFKKFTAVILIIMLLIAPIKKADAIAPALGPAIYYGLGSLIVASGVYAGTSDDVQYIVEDYWDQASDSIKNLWKNTAIYAGTAGYLLVNQSMISDMTEYLVEKGFHSGSNTISESSGQIPITEPFIFDPSINSVFLNNYSVTFSDVQVFTGDKMGLNCNIGSETFYLGLYAGNVASIEQIHSIQIQIYETGSYLVRITVDSTIRKVSNGQLHRGITVAALGYAEVLSALGISEYLLTYIEETFRSYIGDAAGVGTALEPEDELKVPCPPMPEIDWPETWLDELEKSLNEADNPFVDDETTIQEGKEEWDWWIDEWGNPYKVRKGEPPRDPQKDRKIGFPIPMPEPDLPWEVPDINNPYETTIENPPETTSTQNPDGTRTDTTTQTTTTTRRWYDPDTEKWKETTTTTTTTTQQDYDPDGLPIGPPRTVVTTPEGPVKTTDPEKDADRINWDPLKLPLLGLTTKFPFSLPWDLMRGIESLQAEQWDRKFIIPALGPNGLWPEMEIDLSMYDGIAEMTRIVLLIIFDFGLIMATRKLMGGDV